MVRVKWPILKSIITLTVVILQAFGAASVAVPSSNCYALDNSSRIVDFSSLIGHIFEYEGKDPSSDIVVRFCKDVETRAPSGYVDFGRFDKYNHFVASSGRVDFVQGFYNGDLAKCEHTYDKMGRTAQVNIICGSCSNGQCEAGLGCICNVTYESSCRVIIELAIPCEKPGPRVFKGFTVGFHPRSSEIVYNGMTLVGFEKPHKEYSFRTAQTQSALYMTAIASMSLLVQKPIVEVSPEKGLAVELSGSGASGTAPTTLSPTMLIFDWKCEKARNTPYEVNVTIPIQGYEPIQFYLTKMCEYSENEVGNSTRRWAIFGILSCIFMVSSTLFCCGGFIYKTRMEGQHGIYALPGMTFLSACLETVSIGGTGPSYSRPEDVNSAFSANEVSWQRPPSPTSAPAPAPAPAQGAWRPNERKYEAI